MKFLVERIGGGKPKTVEIKTLEELVAWCSKNGSPRYDSSIMLYPGSKKIIVLEPISDDDDGWDDVDLDLKPI